MTDAYIDQRWVSTWGLRAPSEAHLKTLLRWYLEQRRLMRDLIERFPPDSLVRSTDPDQDVPYPCTLGVVSAYGPGPFVWVRPSPSEPHHRVPASALELVHTAEGLGVEVFRALRVLEKNDVSTERPPAVLPPRPVWAEGGARN